MHTWYACSAGQLTPCSQISTKESHTSHTYLDMRTWYARSARQQSPQLEIGTQERHMHYALPEYAYLVRMQRRAIKPLITNQHKGVAHVTHLPRHAHLVRTQCKAIKPPDCEFTQRSGTFYVLCLDMRTWYACSTRKSIHRDHSPEIMHARSYQTCIQCTHIGYRNNIVR
jgi:hypothetical protein